MLASKPQTPSRPLPEHLYAMLDRTVHALEQGVDAEEYIVYARRAVRILPGHQAQLRHPNPCNQQYLLDLVYNALTFTEKPKHAMMPILMSAVMRAFEPGPLEGAVVLAIRDALEKDGWDIHPLSGGCT